MTLLAEFVWAIDKVAFQAGPLTVRWYGVVFALTMLAAYGFWTWQVKRGGYSEKVSGGFLLWGVIATIAGARLGHCLFYEPDVYLKDPLRIIAFWESGLASHGAAIGLTLAVLLYALIHKIRILELMDRFAFSAAVGAAGIRMGNFLNSEIVGRPTDLPWATKFPLHDMGPKAGEAFLRATAEQQELILAQIPARHPSQLYEFSMGLAVLGILLLADRLAGREKRPLGLLAGLFFTCYFGGRFCVEFVKEYQALDDSFLTMGQYLSVIPVIGGLGLLVWCFIKRRPTHPTLLELNPVKSSQPSRKKKSSK